MNSDLAIGFVTDGQRSAVDRVAVVAGAAENKKPTLKNNQNKRIFYSILFFFEIFSRE